MITSVADERIKDVRVTNHELVVALADGRTLSVPLVWYPRLLNATAEQRKDWQLIGDGEGVHWPQIDEDLSVAGLLRGVPAPADRPHHPPAKESGAQAVNMAKDVYSDSIGEAKSKLQHDRSQLESLAEQLPESQEEARAQIQELVDSYTEIENALDQAAQDQGAEDTVSEVVRQAQEAVGQVAQGAQDAVDVTVDQAQDAAGGAADQAQGAIGQVTDQAGQAAQGVQDTAGQVAGQVAEGIHEPDATVTARQRIEELGVDLSEIEGSGAKGRITVKDVTRAAHQ